MLRITRDPISYGALVCGALALLVRLAWVLSVPTRPVGDFAMYLESANYLVTWGHLDRGFIYMPGYVLLVALVKALGGELFAIKLIGVAAGGLSAAAAFGIARRLTDDARVAWLAGVAAALWPAGVAISSVAGTDMPAAALIAAAVWALLAWGPRRPRLAAALFGAVMGLAAYIRAVAFPLCTLSALYWIALARLAPDAALAGAFRRRWREIALCTALACAVALVVVMPWAVRNRVRNGDLRFTDYHGGITALIGSNPNSEGTYTRALNELFTRTTGRWVLDEPHGPVDEDALAMAREWARWEPGYAGGMLIKKAEQLFDGEARLLYWPIFRPGVLREPHRSWFAARQSLFARVADGWWLVLCGCFAAAVALAVVRRRWLALVALPFQAALAVTYIVFFAEPRYRLPIELLAIPLAATVPVWLFDACRRMLRAPERRRVALEATAVLVSLLGVFLGWPRLLVSGATLRRQHRWGTATCTVAGQAHVCKWKRAGEARGDSPVHGAPDAVGIDVETAGATVRATMETGGAPLPAGRYHLRLDVGSSPSTSAQVAVHVGSDTLTLDHPGALDGTFSHDGGPVRLAAEITAGAPGTVWLQDLTIRVAD